jgi:hypothetical protein
MNERNAIEIFTFLSIKDCGERGHSWLASHENPSGAVTFGPRRLSLNPNPYPRSKVAIVKKSVGEIWAPCD